MPVRRVGGGGGGLQVEDHQFLASRYGYKGDGSSSDSAAIIDTIEQADAWAAGASSPYVECLFPVRPTPAILDQALVQGGATKGNSLIPLPIRAGTARKLTLVLKGCVDAAAMPHWNQTVGQRWGVNWKTALTGQTVNANWGPPSILGGPAITGALAEYGQSHSATFNNLCVVIEGIGLSYPVNPSLMGIDLAALAQAVVRRVGMAPDAATSAIAVVVPDKDHTIGLRMPDVGNNDRSVVDDLTVYGMYVGYKPSEHSDTNRAAIIYAHDGLVFGGNLSGFHSLAMGAISVEGVVDAIRVYDSGGRAPVDIQAMSVETVTGKVINDPNNVLRGLINVNKISGTIDVTGATEVRIISTNSERGSVTPPSVPATTVAHRNTFWRDALVRVIGGTVTVIAVDGVTTGATAGEVFVPSGSEIALTYSSPPTWTWRLV